MPLKLEEVKLGDLREEKVRLEGIIDTHNESLKQLIERIKERLQSWKALDKTGKIGTLVLGNANKKSMEVIANEVL